MRINNDKQNLKGTEEKNIKSNQTQIIFKLINLIQIYFLFKIVLTWLFFFSVTKNWLGLKNIYIHMIFDKKKKIVLIK